MADETTPQSAPPQASQQSTPAPASAGSAPSAPPSGGSSYQGGGQGGHGGPRHSGPGGPGGPGGRPGGPAKRGKRSFVRKKKVCRFCVDKVDLIDYKKADVLSSFIQDRGRVLPRRMTGTCARHQRWLTVAIKRAQNIALLPFAAEL